MAISGLIVAVLIILACITRGNPAAPQFEWLAATFFFSQDLPWLVGIAVLLMILAVAPLPLLRSRLKPIFSRRHFAASVILAAGIALCGVVGTYLVFNGYHLSRDEFLADFDARIFLNGHFIAPIDAQWRAFANALAPRYMQPIPGGLGFASAYLPVNAAFRALVGLAADPNYATPLLAAVAVLATFAAARRLWPTRPDAALVCALLVASSPQVVVMSMTSYAMTAHLALNMVWLCFFLRGGRIGHGVAIVVGFLASGIHQVIFHPLFAAPFIVRLWMHGRRPLAFIYVVSYAAICLFWINYWDLVVAVHQAPAEISNSNYGGPLFFVFRVTQVLKEFHWAGYAVMIKNIARFIDWQNPALLPFAILSLSGLRRHGKAPELVCGIVLTTLAMFLLIPYQGHGWGYRYLHGLIGNAALLAGYGWVSLSERGSVNELRAAGAMLAVCTLIAWVCLLPVHAKAAHDFVMPYERASRAIDEASADLVIVDTSRLAFAEDLVRNDPFLRNRPLVLNLSDLSESDIDQLCATSTVAVFDYDIGRYFGIPEAVPPTASGDEERARLRDVIADRGCRLRPLLPKPAT